jgi:hypothetical protein
MFDASHHLMAAVSTPRSRSKDKFGEIGCPGGIWVQARTTSIMQKK